MKPLSNAMSKHEQDRLAYLREFLEEEINKPIRVCSEIVKGGVNVLWYDRKDGSFYLQSVDKKLSNRQFASLESALDAFDGLS